MDEISRRDFGKGLLGAVVFAGLGNSSSSENTFVVDLPVSERNVGEVILDFFTKKDGYPAKSQIPAYTELLWLRRPAARGAHNAPRRRTEIRGRTVRHTIAVAHYFPRLAERCCPLKRITHVAHASGLRLLRHVPLPLRKRSKKELDAPYHNQ